MNERKQSLWTWDFWGITLINFLIFSAFQMLTPTLPIRVKALGGTDAVIGWIMGVVTIASLIIRPLSGLALDKWGRKGVFIAGLGVILLTTVAYGWVPAVGLLLAIRFVHGLGWGAATTASNTVASDVIPKRRFGEGMGFFSLSGSLAMAVAPGLGLALLNAFQFGSMTLVSAGLGILATLLAFFIGYRRLDAQPTRRAKAAPQAKAAPYERASIPPAVVMFFITATYGAIVSFISLYAGEQGIRNIGPYFAIYAVSLIVSRPLFGRLVDRFGYNSAIYPGLIILIAGLAVLSTASALPMFLVSALLYGVGFSAPPTRIGAANATFFTGFDGGIGFGSVVAGIVAAAAGYGAMYLEFAAFLVIAGVLYFVVTRRAVPAPAARRGPSLDNGQPSGE